MRNHLEDPDICKGCQTESCNGDYLKCMQDVEDSRADYEYERKRDDRACEDSNRECPR